MPSSAHYSPRDRLIRLPSNPTIYEVAHEVSHLDQHAENSIVWRLDVACQGVPVVRRVCRLALEIDAMRRARAQMTAGGAWSGKARTEAARNLLAYLFGPGGIIG